MNRRRVQGVLAMTSSPVRVGVGGEKIPDVALVRGGYGHTPSAANLSGVVGQYPSEALLAAARDAVLVVDDARTIVDANPAACRLLGRPLEAVLGRRFDD